MFRPGMRAYMLPLVSGMTLTLSAFLPWVIVGGVRITGFPDVPAIWVAGLGLLASVLAALSMITRRNSRHPLLVVGLVALGIMILSWRIMPRSAGQRALTVSQAFAIVQDRPLGGAPPETSAGSGIYLGMAAAALISGFGLTIVVRRAAQPYAVTSVDDDV